MQDTILYLICIAIHWHLAGIEYKKITALLKHCGYLKLHTANRLSVSFKFQFNYNLPNSQIKNEISDLRY